MTESSQQCLISTMRAILLSAAVPPTWPKSYQTIRTIKMPSGHGSGLSGQMTLPVEDLVGHRSPSPSQGRHLLPYSSKEKLSKIAKGWVHLSALLSCHVVLTKILVTVLTKILVTVWVMSYLSFVTIWNLSHLEFCHTICLVTDWVLSLYEFCDNLSILTIWVLSKIKCCHNFWSGSNLEIC